MQSLPRSLFIFVFCIPLAVVFGVMLATPLDRTSMLSVAVGFFLLLTPLLIGNHHGFLIMSISAYINAYFLPGQPQLWLLAGILSAFFTVLTRTLNRGKRAVSGDPSITWSLIFLFVVTFTTSYFTGGVGARAIGSGNFGGRKYIYLWGAVLVYFLISRTALPEKRRNFYIGAYFLSAVTSAISNLAYTLGPDFYFLFLLFPSEYAFMQAAGDDVNAITRISGLGPAGMAIVSFMLLRYSLRGCLSVQKFWRPIVLFGAFGIGMFSGFRSVFVFPIVLVVILFMVEGLYKTRFLPLFIVVTVLTAAFLIPFADHLPLSVQRCLTILPLNLNPSAVMDARGSSEWRLEIWRSIVPDIPKYLWLGKGYSIDPKDLYFAQEGFRLGGSANFETAITAGDYHSGPLTIIIPFGIWGVLGFIWFSAASIRVLWVNFKNSSPEMKRANSFFFAYFIAKIVFFVFVFGAFFVDMLFFTTLVALSISMNGGIRRVPWMEASELEEAEPHPATMPEQEFQPA